MADTAGEFPQFGLSDGDSRTCPRCGQKIAKGAKTCRYGHAVITEATEEPLSRRVRAMEGHFEDRLHPRGRDGEWVGEGGVRLRAAVGMAQHLNRVHSKLRLRRDGGEQGLDQRIASVAAQRQQSERELASHGYHLTPQGRPVPIDQPVGEVDGAFWDAQIADTQAALAAATDPRDRAMLGRHLQKLKGTP